MASITIINQFYVPDISPTAHLAASLAEHLAAEGHVVNVVTSRSGYVKSKNQAAGHPGAATTGQCVAAAPRVHRLWSTSLGKSTHLRRVLDYTGFYAMAIGRMLTLGRQDVIISLTTPPFIAWAAVFHRLLHRRTKIVLWCMDCYPDAAERMQVIRKGSVGSRILRAINRALFRRLDHLIVLDTAMKDLLLSQYTDARRPLLASVIPNWERAEMFPAAACNGSGASSTDHFSGASPGMSMLEDPAVRDRFTILYLGNMGYGHHFDSVLDAAETLRDKPVVFLFIGGGKRKDELEAQAKRRRLPNIVVRPYIPKEQTPSLMAGVNAALITLRDDVLGVMSPSKLHSNLAMGLPVVYLGPRGSNVDDAIQRFGCGVSLAMDDARGLARFVNDVIDRSETYQRLRQAARRAFDEAYCDLRTLPQFCAIVDALSPDDRVTSAALRLTTDSTSQGQ